MGIVGYTGLYKVIIKSFFGGNVDTWLYRFPTSFVDLLCVMDNHTLKSVVPIWSKTAEIEHFGTREVEEILSNLQRLALEAKHSNRHLFLWGAI
jgi:hypothetical protein